MRSLVSIILVLLVLNPFVFILAMPTRKESLGTWTRKLKNLQILDYQCKKVDHTGQCHNKRLKYKKTNKKQKPK